MHWQTVDIRIMVQAADLVEFADWLCSLDVRNCVGNPKAPDDCPIYRWLWEGRQLENYLSFLLVCYRWLRYGVGENTFVKPLPLWAVEFQDRALEYARKYGIRNITAGEALLVLEKCGIVPWAC